MQSFRSPAALAIMLLLGGASGLAGCVYTSKETEQVSAPPPTIVVAQPAQRIYTHPEGRYELHGDGTSGSPYYWVWIPAGTQSVPPPPLPPFSR